jgi:hypothetical protein
MTLVEELSLNVQLFDTVRDAIECLPGMTKLRKLVMRFSTPILNTAMYVGEYKEDYLPGLITAIGENPRIEKVELSHCSPGFDRVRANYDEQVKSLLGAMPPSVRIIRFKGEVLRPSSTPIGWGPNTLRDITNIAN